MVNCACCEQQERVDCAGSLEIFAAVRSRCPALHQIFVPDQIWNDFQQWHRQPDLVAQHRSILILAMKRGHLGRVTSAVHRYLMTEGGPRPDISQQYLSDLREKWMLCQSPEDRHQKSRRFIGRLVELQFAEWLESNGWSDLGLEAFRVGPDIDANKEGRRVAFEVKFIGRQNTDFAAFLQSNAGQSAATSVSPYDAKNYLMFRVYEAAKQLQRINCDRIAVVVVEDVAWANFETQVTEGWIEWANPQFSDRHSERWTKFVQSQKTRYPNLSDDLQPTVRSLNEVWILIMRSDFQYDLVGSYPLKE